jgi:hypothetical protein
MVSVLVLSPADPAPTLYKFKAFAFLGICTVLTDTGLMPPKATKLINATLTRRFNKLISQFSLLIWRLIKLPFNQHLTVIILNRLLKE